MKINRKLVAVAAAIAAVAAGGVGIAQAVGGGSEEQVTGPSAEKAKSAALKAVGAGTVTEVERQEGGRGFEVEVRRNDGSHVDVRVSDRYQSLGTESGEDEKSGSGEDSKGAAEDR